MPENIRRFPADRPRRRRVPRIFLLIALLAPGAPTSLGAQESPLDIVLIAPTGEREVDREIVRLQGEVANSQAPLPALSRLGFSFVQKGKECHDPGQFTLARICAEEITRLDPENLDGLLLEGHVLQNLHLFASAEEIARRLVAERGSALDYGVLGDACLEQGKLEEATLAYQAMVDRRPGPAAYTRIAHLRWLRGDTRGAAELFARAVRSTSARDRFGLTYARTRLARTVVGLGQPELASKILAPELSLEEQADPAALLLSGLIEFDRDTALAAERLDAAAQRGGFPEYEWAASDSARARGDFEGAEAWEATLLARGPIDDPRTTALFLATRGQNTELAVTLARAELLTRQDVHSYDTLAWALFANGDRAAAREPMARALREGTADPRILLHGARIAEAGAHFEEAADLTARAKAARTLLLPSERAQLSAIEHRLSAAATSPQREGG